MDQMNGLFPWSTWISAIADRVGCEEAALRLIISTHFSYPICILYNLFLADKPATIKHVYNFLSGIFLVYFNYGINTFHSLITCLVVYATLFIFGGTRTAVALNFTFCMTYLLAAYYLTQVTAEYSFTWTIPQCVLTLRLIALTFDVYDGQRNKRRVKKDDDGDKKSVAPVNEDTAVDGCPSLIELLSHAFFPGTILIGPLVTYNSYINFIRSKENFLPRSWLPGLNRLALGLIYLAIYQIGILQWPSSYLISKEFEEDSFWMKFTSIAIVMKISICKYMSGWLIAEGACIMSGVSYDAKTNSFYGCSNVHIYKFETTTTFGGIIRSFNLTTNAFAAKYIFKRLKFLGSKTLSHFLTLLFLALWHGWSTGYYITFGMEFLIMKMEWEVLSIVKSLRTKVKLIDRFLTDCHWPLAIINRIYLIYMLGYCLTPFTLLSYQRWLPVLRQVYFSGHIIYGTWLVVSSLASFSSLL